MTSTTSGPMDLPDELILTIGTFVVHPPYILNFTRTCRRLHGLTIPLLYEKITLNYENYSTSPYYTPCARRVGKAQPLLAIKSLTSTLLQDYNSTTPRLCPVIHSLKLSAPSNMNIYCFGIRALLHHLTSLTELRVESLERERSTSTAVKCICPSQDQVVPCAQPRTKPACFLPISRLDYALYPLKDTLRTLTIFTDTRACTLETGYPMDDFRYMTALECLDVQGFVFCGTYQIGTNPEQHITALNKRLPPNIRVLHLRCYSWSVNLRYPHNNRPFAGQTFQEANKTIRLLIEYLEQSERSQPLLEKVVVWLPEAWGNDWPEVWRKVTATLEAVSAVAAKQSIKIIMEDIDDMQWGTSEYPGEEYADCKAEKAGSG